MQRDNATPYTWEKKGSSLYATKNVLKYQELRQSTFRLLNKILKSGGKVFYVGIKKDPPKENHSPKKLYRSVRKEAIKRMDQYCLKSICTIFMILDEKEQSFRSEIVREATIQMYGPDKRKCLIEPPIQAESHLFQTLQCADWLCGLIGRVATYQTCPGEFSELSWTDKYFKARLFAAAPNSGVRF